MLTDGGGHLIHPKVDGRYSIDIGLGRFTGAVTAGAIFAMRNGILRHCKIHKIVLCVGFAGTTAATSQIIQIKRFNTATHSGGTAITISTGVIKNENGPIRSSTLADARYADITGTAPLTATSVVYEASCGSVNFPRSSGGGPSQLEVHWDAPDEFHLTDESEGLALVTTQTAVVGDTITGWIEWSELTDDQEL